MSPTVAHLVAGFAWAHGIMTMVHGLEQASVPLVLFGLATCCGARFARLYAEGRIVDRTKEGDSGG